MVWNNLFYVTDFLEQLRFAYFFKKKFIKQLILMTV